MTPTQEGLARFQTGDCGSWVEFSPPPPEEPPLHCLFFLIPVQLSSPSSLPSFFSSLLLTFLCFSCFVLHRLKLPPCFSSGVSEFQTSFLLLLLLRCHFLFPPLPVSCLATGHHRMKWPGVFILCGISAAVVESFWAAATDDWAPSRQKKAPAAAAAAASQPSCSDLCTPRCPPPSPDLIGYYPNQPVLAF